MEHNGLGWLKQAVGNEPMEFKSEKMALEYLEKNLKDHNVETTFYVVDMMITGRIHTETVRKLRAN